MKKTIKMNLIAAVLTVLALSFAACQNSDIDANEHTCVFNKDLPTSTYMKSDVTCTSKAFFYKSCECGAKGTETFAYGVKLPHTYDRKIESNEYLKESGNCSQKAVYYKSCVCGAVGNGIFESLTFGQHSEIEISAKSADCVTDGYAAWKKCEICDYITLQPKIINALGHKYVDGTCSECNFQCEHKELIENVCKECKSKCEIYTISVMTMGGKPFGNATVNIKSTDGIIEIKTLTNENGITTVNLISKKDYTATLAIDAIGYTVNSEGYAINELNTTIKLMPKLIASESEEDYKNANYELGDTMYDFTLTTIEKNEEIRLSGLLESGKKGLLLYFWCPCKICRSEFECIQKAYEKFEDEISVIAINNFNLETSSACTFDFSNGNSTLEQAFGIYAFPTFVFIDRYGTIIFINLGATQNEEIFSNLFSKACDDEYTQVLYTSYKDLIT